MTIDNTELVDQAVFRDVAGHFATGVTVITSTDGNTPAGTTASAVASLSMDPPMMLICLNRSSATHDVVAASRVFGVNILAQNQAGTALQFARKGTDKFAGVDWSAAPGNVPWIDGALASIACRVVETAVGGTHTVFMGEVLAAESFPGEPLTYFRGSFGTIDQEAEAKAYVALRAHVLARRTPLGGVVDPQELAAPFHSRPEFVRRAIIRLAAEGLLEQTPEGTAVVAPITMDLARGFFSAQAAIESGVIDTHLPFAPQQQLDEFAATRDSLAALDADASSDLDSYLSAVKGFHRQLIGLSPSLQLMGAYGELTTAPLWLSLLPEGERVQILDMGNLLDLAGALAHRDADAARAAIRRHLHVVIDIAEQVIEARGGRV